MSRWEATPEEIEAARQREALWRMKIQALRQRFLAAVARRLGLQ